MIVKRLLMLMILLSLILTACGGDDEDEDTDSNDSNPTSAPAENNDSGDSDDAEGGDAAAAAENADEAMVAYVSGRYDEAAGFFCDNVKEQIEAAGEAAAGAQIPEGTEVSATCTAGSDSVTCEVKSTTSGVEVPMGSYSIAVVGGELCGLPTPVQ